MGHCSILANLYKALEIYLKKFSRACRDILKRFVQCPYLARSSDYAYKYLSPALFENVAFVLTFA